MEASVQSRPGARPPTLPSITPASTSASISSAASDKSAATTSRECWPSSGRGARSGTVLSDIRAGPTEQLDAPVHRVVDLANEAAANQVRVLVQVLRVEHGARRDAGVAEQPHPLVFVAFRPPTRRFPTARAPRGSPGGPHGPRSAGPRCRSGRAIARHRSFHMSVGDGHHEQVVVRTVAPGTCRGTSSDGPPLPMRSGRPRSRTACLPWPFSR